MRVVLGIFAAAVLVLCQCKGAPTEQGGRGSETNGRAGMVAEGRRAQPVQLRVMAVGAEARRVAPRSAVPRRAAARPAQARPAAPGLLAWDPRVELLSGVTVDFDSGERGHLPASMFSMTGRWALARDESARSGKGVLAQLAAGDDSAFNVLLLKGRGNRYRDLWLSVWLRAVRGKVDQGGGLLWRAMDEKNYYVARYNPLEDNLRLYHVKGGRRKMLAGTTLRVDHRAWHHLEVTMVGDRITVSLDGRKRLEKNDATFSGAGRLGLWTKADARSHFDDLSFAVARASTARPKAAGPKPAGRAPPHRPAP